MSYFLLTVLLWLAANAPKIEFSFNPWAIAFLIAIVVDLYIMRPWKLLNK